MTDGKDPTKGQLAAIVVEQQRMINALAEHVGIENEGLLSRRDLIQGGAFAGAAGLLVGASASPAAADASASDSDGDVGAPNNRVDGFFDGVGANSVQTDALNIAGSQLYASGEFAEIQTWRPDANSDQTTTSTSYTTIWGQNPPWIDLDNIPDAASGYVRLIQRMKNDTSNETTSARVEAFDSGFNFDQLTETEVSVTNTSLDLVDSGWVEITTVPDDSIYLPRIQGKVSGGTGTFRWNEAAILWGWRI